MQNKKTIKSFKQLSELNRREIFNKKGNLKTIDKKLAVSIARQLASGFDNIDLRKQPSQSEYKRARKYINEFYSSIRSEKIKIIRPQKQNRKYYAEFSASSPKFKVFAVPSITDKDTFKVIGKGKNKKIKRFSEYSNAEFFKFDSRKKLITKTKEEIKGTFKKVKTKYKKRPFEVKIKCGKGEHKVKLTDQKEVTKEIENLMNAYGADNVKKWALGLVAYTFNKQEPLPSSLKRKGYKKKKRTKFK